MLASTDFERGGSLIPARDYVEEPFAASKKKEKKKKKKKRAVLILLVLIMLKYLVNNVNNAVLEYLRRSFGTNSNDVSTR